jgi:hypothetical protein
MPNPQFNQDPPVDPEGVQTNRPDAVDAPQYPYTDLRPEARGEVTPDNPGRLVGDDATATFDNGPSNPTERASSEALAAATRINPNTAAVDQSDMRDLNTEDANPDTNTA